MRCPGPGASGGGNRTAGAKQRIEVCVVKDNGVSRSKDCYCR